MKNRSRKIRKIICSVIAAISVAMVFFCLYVVTRGRDVVEYVIRGFISLAIAVIADFIGGIGKNEA